MFDVNDWNVDSSSVDLNNSLFGACSVAKTSSKALQKTESKRHKDKTVNIKSKILGERKDMAKKMNKQNHNISKIANLTLETNGQKNKYANNIAKGMKCSSENRHDTDHPKKEKRNLETTDAPTLTNTMLSQKKSKKNHTYFSNDGQTKGEMLSENKTVIPKKKRVRNKYKDFDKKRKETQEVVISDVKSVGSQKKKKNRDSQKPEETGLSPDKEQIVHKKKKRKNKQAELAQKGEPAETYIPMHKKTKNKYKDLHDKQIAEKATSQPDSKIKQSNINDGAMQAVEIEENGKCKKRKRKKLQENQSSQSPKKAKLELSNSDHATEQHKKSISISETACGSEKSKKIKKKEQKSQSIKFKKSVSTKKQSDEEQKPNKDKLATFDPKRLKSILIHNPVKQNKSNAKLKSIASSENKELDFDQPEDKKGVKFKDMSLRDRMMEQLKSARFRYINEQLYSCTGRDAMRMFRDDKGAFEVYHDGYQSQVSKWPQNPVDQIIKFIESRHGNQVIADLGCGDAKLARSVKNRVHSFDLVSTSSRVIQCDMAKVPLPDSCVDVAVFCLSLMGTNLTDFLYEAWRILRHGGIMKIAEVVSRFKGYSNFTQKVEKLGFALEKKDTSNKMFVMFDFKKKAAPKADLPVITLEPCRYKKR